MVGFRPGIARCRQLPGRVSGLAMATGLLVAACGPAQTTSTGTATAHGTAKPSSSASPSPRSTADCASVTTCLGYSRKWSRRDRDTTCRD